MNKKYCGTIQLRCPIWGSIDINVNEDNSYGKCNMCNKEFPGGYDELVELNQATIDASVEDRKAEIAKDFEKELYDRHKNSFKGSKYINIK